MEDLLLLTEDLLEAGIRVVDISCEKETGTIIYTPETLLKDYEQIRSDDTDYVISCVWNDIPFQACTADDTSGRSDSRGSALPWPPWKKLKGS